MMLTRWDHAAIKDVESGRYTYASVRDCAKLAGQSSVVLRSRRMMDLLDAGHIECDGEGVLRPTPNPPTP